MIFSLAKQRQRGFVWFLIQWAITGMRGSTNMARGGHDLTFDRRFIYDISTMQKHSIVRNCNSPGDLNARKSTGTSSQTEIHFSIKTTKFLVKHLILPSIIRFPLI